MAPEQPAFIDHEPDGSGGYRTVAAIRCPALPPGDHDVVVRLPGGEYVEGQGITIIQP